MRKKLLSILLVLSLMLALVPAAFAADTGTLEGGLTWELGQHRSADHLRRGCYPR